VQKVAHHGILVSHHSFFLFHLFYFIFDLSNAKKAIMKLELKNITKAYGKDQFAVSAFSLNIEKGVLGLLGPNGAGKSTLLRMIATASKPTRGNITLNETNIVQSPNYMRKQLGFLPQDFGVYPNLNAFEFLSYMAALKGVGGKGLKNKINSLLAGLNLLDAADKPIGNYSGGMKQRIGIAQALINNPKVLLLDEPTVGLDPEERLRFRNLISDLAQESIIILSSHIVSDIDTIADKVAIMNKGKLIVADNIPVILSQLTNKVFEIRMPKTALNSFKENNLIVSTQRDGDHLLVRYINTSQQEGEMVKPTLEDAFLFMTKTNQDV